MFVKKGHQNRTNTIQYTENVFGRTFSEQEPMPCFSLGVMVYACRVRLAISVNGQFGEQISLLFPSPLLRGERIILEI
jgi:hypothetical protein